MEECPECGSKKLEWNNHGLMCKKCGIMLSEAYYSGRMVV